MSVSTTPTVVVDETSVPYTHISVNSPEVWAAVLLFEQKNECEFDLNIG